MSTRIERHETITLNPKNGNTDVKAEKDKIKEPIFFRSFQQRYWSNQWSYFCHNWRSGSNACCRSWSWKICIKESWHKK